MSKTPTIREQIIACFPCDDCESCGCKYIQDPDPKTLDFIEALISQSVIEARINSLLDLEHWVKLHNLDKDMIMDGIEHMVRSLLQVPDQPHQVHTERIQELKTLANKGGES